MKDEESLLPALPDEEISLDHIQQPDIPDFQINTHATSIKKNDLELATMGLKVVAESWKHATSFSRVMRLLKEQRDAVKFRRDVMGIPYGSQGSGTREIDLNPIDN